MDIFWGIQAGEHTPWGWMVALYFFMAGISGGAFLTASLTDVFSKNAPAKIIKAGAYISPVAIVIGLGFIILDLSKPFTFWKLLLYVNTSSVMSIGTFILSIFAALAFAYGFLVWAESATRLTGFWLKLAEFINRISLLRKPVALLGAFFAVCTVCYTAYLLSAVATITLWTLPFFGVDLVPFLAVLFLVSGVSTGLAATLLAASKSDDLSTYKKVDTVLIVLEIILLAMLYSAVGPIYFNSMASLFWIGVVAIGLVLPLILSIYSLFKHTNLLIPVCTMVIIGGFFLRYFIIYSGQLV